MQIDNKIIGTEGSLLYSGLDLVPESGDLIVRRHDGKEIVEPGFEFENCALQTCCQTVGWVWVLGAGCWVLGVRRGGEGVKRVPSCGG